MTYASENTTTQCRFARCSSIALYILVIAVFGFAKPALADIFLTTSSPTPLSEGLVSYRLLAVSAEGETINGVQNPSIVPNFGDAGLHQVWTPITNAPTPTRQEQLTAGVLWSDDWLAYDSYFFFDSSLALSVGGSFTETNSMTGGAVLPSAGFGAPTTGFGSYGATSPGAAKAFTIASGRQGTTVEFVQLVMKQDEGVFVSLTVLTNEGITAQFSDVPVGCVFDCGPSISDQDLGDVLRGEIITTTLSAHPLVQFEPGTWRLDEFTGPDGSPVAGATVDADSGLFSWNSTGQLLGPYSAIIGRDLVGGHPVSGTLTFNLVVPEPATTTLVILATAHVFGLLRRRSTTVH